MEHRPHNRLPYAAATAVVLALVALVLSACGSGDDNTSSRQSSAGSGPDRGFNASGDAADKSRPQGTPCCYHGKVSLHYNAYGDYGYCSPEAHAKWGKDFFDCWGKYEASPDNTDPYCCNKGGQVSVRPLYRTPIPNWCGGTCEWELTFYGSNNQFTCYVRGAATNSACYTGKDQAAERIGEPGGPLRLYVGNSQVFGVHGYVP